MFYELPDVESSTNQITVTCGTGSSLAQTTVSESSDDGTGQFFSPFAPTDCHVFANAAGNVGLTWTNNTDNETAIYIEQQQSDGSWKEIASLPPGTTSYSITAPLPGAYRIDPQIPTPGGGSGDPPGPGNDPPIPILNYVAIDMSGATTGTDVTAVAMDDNNDAAYDVLWSSTGATVWTWTSGTSSPPQNDNLDPPPVLISGTDTFLEQNASFYLLTPSGAGYGPGGGSTYSTAVPSPYSSAISYWATGYETATSGSLIRISAQSPPYSTFTGSGDDGDGTGDNNYTIINDANNSGYCGSVYGWWGPLSPEPPGVLGWYGAPPSGTGWAWTNGGFIVGPAGTIVFDPVFAQYGQPLAGAQVISADFIPNRMSSNGYAFGYSSAAVAYLYVGGSNVVSPAPMSDPTAINDKAQVMGVDEGGDAYLWTQSPVWISGTAWTSGTGTLLISDLIPTPFQAQITGIIPLDISGTNANGDVDVLFHSNNSGQPGTFLLTLTGTGATNGNTLQQMALPPNVSTGWYINSLFNLGQYQGSATINAQGNIATLGTIITGNVPSRQKALLLLPVPLINKADPTVRNEANGNDTPISFLQSGSDTNIAAVAWIAATNTNGTVDANGFYPPRMPNLVASSGSIPGLTYCWKLQVTFHDREGNPHRDFDTSDPNDSNTSPNLLTNPYSHPGVYTTITPDQITVPAITGTEDPSNVANWRQITDGTPWNIYQDPAWQSAVGQGFFGGDATLSLAILSGTNVVLPEQDFKFRIAGENPDPDYCKAYINANDQTFLVCLRYR